MTFREKIWRVLLDGKPHTLADMLSKIDEPPAGAKHRAETFMRDLWLKGALRVVQCRRGNVPAVYQIADKSRWAPAKPTPIGRTVHLTNTRRNEDGLSCVVLPNRDSWGL